MSYAKIIANRTNKHEFHCKSCEYAWRPSTHILRKVFVHKLSCVFKVWLTTIFDIFSFFFTQKVSWKNTNKKNHNFQRLNNYLHSSNDNSQWICLTLNTQRLIEIRVYFTVAAIIQTCDTCVMHHGYNTVHSHRPHKIPVRWSVCVLFALNLGFFLRSVKLKRLRDRGQSSGIMVFTWY